MQGVELRLDAGGALAGARFACRDCGFETELTYLRWGPPPPSSSLGLPPGPPPPPAKRARGEGGQDDEQEHEEEEDGLGGPGAPFARPPPPGRVLPLICRCARSSEAQDETVLSEQYVRRASARAAGRVEFDDERGVACTLLIPPDATWEWRPRTVRGNETGRALIRHEATARGRLLLRRAGVAADGAEQAQTLDVQLARFQCRDEDLADVLSLQLEGGSGGARALAFEWRRFVVYEQ